MHHRHTDHFVVLFKAAEFAGAYHVKRLHYSSSNSCRQCSSWDDGVRRRAPHRPDLPAGAVYMPNFSRRLHRRSFTTIGPNGTNERIFTCSGQLWLRLPTSSSASSRQRLAQKKKSSRQRNKLNYTITGLSLLISETCASKMLICVHETKWPAGYEYMMISSTWYSIAQSNIHYGPVWNGEFP